MDREDGVDHDRDESDHEDDGVVGNQGEPEAGDGDRDGDNDGDVQPAEDLGPEVLPQYVPEGVYFTPIVTFRINGDVITHSKTPMSAEEVHALLLQEHMTMIEPILPTLTADPWKEYRLPPIRFIYYAFITPPGVIGYPIINRAVTYNKKDLFVRDMRSLVDVMRAYEEPRSAYLIKIIDGVCVPFDASDKWLCKKPLKFKEIYMRNDRDHDPLRPAK